MEGAACEDAEPIFELAVRCERLYTEQIARLNEDSRTNGAAILSELNQRFAAWAAFLGVFAESKVCLDRRLRHHVEIQEQVLRLLDIMERNLAFVCEADNTPGPMEVEHPDEPQHLGLNIENLEAISEAIERLNNIGIAIRQSSVTSHTAKARGFAETFDFTSFEGFAYIAFKTMYVAASEELLGLLTRSMTETYALFLHRKSRHEKLQAPRSQPQTPVPLHTISEESAADADAGSRMNLDPQLSQQSRNSTNTRLRPLPPSLQVPKTTPRSEPTSVDSQEAKARIRKKLSPSIKGATKSILVSQADYPLPTKGSMTCEWCFSPLPINVGEGDKWQKHVNEDHRPYLCILENCPESSPRFATSRQWFEHMLTTHGPNWHLEAYAPSSWICPLCIDDDTTFSIPGDLASHLADSHGKTFTQPQIQAIVHQSQIRSLRPRNECPLCCLSIEAQQDSLSKEKSKGKEEEPTSKKSRGDADVDRSHKRIKIEAGCTELDQHIRGDGQRAPMEQQQQKQKAQPNPPPTQHLTVESIASHVAGHLQAIMALTLRMISIDVPIGVSADNQSVGGGTDDHLSRAGSIQRNLDQESDIMEDIQMPEDGYVNPDDCPRPEEIPDSEEHFNWNNMRPDNEGSVVDDFLHRVIDSVAFRSHLGKGEDPTQMSDEDLELLQNFRTTDPRDDKRRIEHTKGGLLRDSYYWILDNADFRRWRNDGETRLLWIKGNPGMGKTMLLCGLIDELKKSTIKTAVLSFFFCQATDSRTNNATAVLRGLVYLLVKQQPSFISHIRKKYDYAGKALFEDANSWSALSNILADILQDPSLNNTYLIIDALDECIVDLPKLLAFIIQISPASSRVKWLVSSRSWPDIVCGNRALHFASQFGHEKIDTKADLQAQNNVRNTALESAALGDHISIIKLLIDSGAAINSSIGNSKNALYNAAFSGKYPATKMLLDHGADINAQNGTYGNALQAAAYQGHELIVKLLLDKGADINAQGGTYDNALQAAAYQGHEPIVKLLLDKGADVNAQGGTYGKLLLDKKADINAQGGTYGNALQAAAYQEHEPIVKLLLDKGADINAQGGTYGNALQAAAYQGHEPIVKLLLDKGADVNAQGGTYGKLLLDKKADINAQGGTYGNALQAAAYQGYEPIVKLLFDKGADINAQGGTYGNALQAAAYQKYKFIVKLLLDKGADINT